MADSDGKDLVEAARETRALIFAALGSAAFAAIGAASIRDWELLSGNGAVALPVLSVNVSVHMYFYAAPAFLFLLFLYTYEDLQRLAADVANGRKEKEEKSSRFTVWPLSQLPLPDAGDGRMVSVLTQLVVWASWPLVGVLCSLRTLPLRDVAIAAWNVVFAAASLGISLHYWAMTTGALSVWPRRLVAWGLGPAGCLGIVLYPTLGASSAFAGARYSDFHKADIPSLDLANRNLRGANFEAAEIQHVRFCGADLTHASLRGAHARGANFLCGPTVGLATADFGDADLTRANFWNGVLDHADFSDAEIGEAVLDEIHAEGASFRGAKGARPGFFLAKLSRASFARATLKDPNFTSAVLRGADLSEAVLAGAHLRGADLTGANLRGADLTGMDYDDETRFEGAKYNRFTVVPGDFDRDAHGMKREE